MAQASATHTFNIPAQPLGTTLVRFSEATGLQLFIDASVARGLNSPGVSGTMTAEEALRRLLAGTGLVYRFTNATTITLERPGSSVAPGVMQLDPVQVQGYPVPQQALIDNIPPPYAGGQVATGGQLGLLGNRDVMDTPFNQTSYTAKKAQDQQAKTVRDVLIDDPSVRMALPDGNPASDMVTIRGFRVAPQATTYNGLLGILPNYSIMAQLAERIEVLKGPSAMLNGMAATSNSIGGSINLVPKRASEEPLTQFTANYISNSQFGAHADFGRRLGPEKQVGVRFNGAYQAGETAVQGTSDKRALAALGLDFRGERVRVSADLGYQYQYINGLVPYLGLATNVPLPWAPNASRNIGQPWTYGERKDVFGVVHGEVDLTERITAYAALGAHDSRLGSLFGGSGITITGFNGNFTSAPNLYSQYDTYFTGEAGLRASVDTGPIGHELAFNAMAYVNNEGVGQNGGTAYTTNIYNPVIQAYPNLAMPAANRTSTTGLSSLGFADTLSAADKRIQLTVGARLQRVTAQNFDPVSGAPTSSYDESAVSPSVALVFKPWQNVSVYGNWIQGLQQGTIVNSTFANAGEVLPPYKTTQYEAGVKVDWGKLTTTASVFQISMPSTITDVATNTLVLGGEQRNQGLELNFFGEVADGVRVLGGAMFLSAVLTKTQGGLTDGWIAPFSPGAQFNLAGEWDLPYVRGLTLNGRAVYTGPQYVDTTYPRRSLAQWTRFDIGARYTFDNLSPTGRPVVIRFNVENVLDNDYWAGGANVSQLFIGAPRTFRLSLTSDF